MRIGFDAKRIFHNITGLGNYGRDVIRILHEHTPINELILYNTKPPRETRLSKSDNYSVKYPDQWFWKKFSSIWRLSAVTKQIRRDRVDIYHGLSGEIPRGLKKNYISSIVTIHDLIFLSHPHYYSLFDRFIYKIKFRYAVNHADGIIAISEQTKRDIVKYSDVDEDKIRVVYQGCNGAYKESHDINTKKIVAEKYGLPQEYVLYVGTLQERKNALTLVKAIDGTPYTLVIVGNEKKYAKKIHAYITEQEIQQQVLFLKNIPVKELAVIYDLATVFCYPSICEGFGIPIIEALFSKTPVITSKGSCFPEAGGPSSIYIDPYDISTLRKHLMDLFQNEKLREEMIKDGYAFAQKFNDHAVAKKIFNVYTTVLENKKKVFNIDKSVNKISALLITYNEIGHIDSVLENLGFADEIIVVDSNSTDGTVEKIQKHPHVTLIQRPFKNYTDQKSFALQQATHDWILFPDADERITDALKNEILETVHDSETDADAFYFYRTFMFEDKVLNFSGWQSDKNYRLFRKSKARFTEDRIVHETLIVSGKSDALKNKLIHYTYKNFEDYKGKMISYGRLKAREELKKEYSPNVFHLWIKPMYKFLNHYIFRLGFLDGKKGAIISYLNALSVHERYKELRKLRLNK